MTDSDNSATKEKMFQSYSSSRPSAKVITTLGRVIRFTRNAFITDNQEEIDYLDDEIAKRGLRGITKGKPVTSLEADPMEGLRRKHIAEYLAAEAAELQASTTDMGKSDQSKAKPIASDALQALLAKNKA